MRGATPIRRLILPVAAALAAACLLVVVAAPSPAAARCPSFKVRASKAAGALGAGRYSVTPVAGAEDPCEAASTVVQSYLYDPPTFGRWRVHHLSRGRGVRFVLERKGVSVTVRRRSSARVAVARSARSTPVAQAAETHTCTIFQVVHNDSAAGFPAGFYHRLTFAPGTKQLNCNPPLPDSYDLLRDYLFDGRIVGWTVGALQGGLASSPGCRFLKNGSSAATGFDVWCDGHSGSRGPCATARPLPRNCSG